MREDLGNVGSRKSKTSLLAGCAAVLGFATLVPQQAQAQWFWDTPHLSADDAARVVAERGFRPLRRPFRNENVYVADVVDRRGRHERLIVSADSGEILQRFYLEEGEGYRRFADPSIPPGPIPPGRIPEENKQPNLFSRLFGGGQDNADHPVPLAPEHAVPAPAEPRPHVRRTPRVVERSPEPVHRSPTIESAPLTPSADTAPTSPAPRPTPAEPAQKPSSEPSVASLPPAKPGRSISSDPLAIPGSREQDDRKVRSSTPAASASAKATPAADKPVAAVPAPAAATKSVPVAPLD